MIGQIEVEVSLGAQRHRRTITTSPLQIGRSPDNGLSLINDQLSWQHAALWVDDGQLRIRDLRSTNGTFINGVRLRGVGVVSPGDTVTFGHDVTLRVLGLIEAAETMRLVLEDLDRSLRYPLSIGVTRPDDLPALDLPGTLTLSADGALTLTVSGQASPVAPGSRFAATDGRLLQVVDTRRLQSEQTAGLPGEDFPYRLSVTISGPRGYEADFTNRQTGRTYRMSTENRVVLLYLLTRKLVEDIAAGVSPEDRGWCADADLATGIWGKRAGDAKRLPVLVHRVRRELEGAGFDHQILEKGRRVLRLRLMDVEVG